MKSTQDHARQVVRRSNLGDGCAVAIAPTWALQVPVLSQEAPSSAPAGYA